MLKTKRPSVAALYQKMYALKYKTFCFKQGFIPTFSPSFPKLHVKYSSSFSPPACSKATTRHYVGIGHIFFNKHTHIKIHRLKTA